MAEKQSTMSLKSTDLLAEVNSADERIGENQIRKIGRGNIFLPAKQFTRVSEKGEYAFVTQNIPVFSLI